MAYQRLAQDEGGPPRAGGSRQGRHAIDIGALTKSLEHWTAAITKKFRRRKHHRGQDREIISSVFVPADFNALGIHAGHEAPQRTFDHRERPMTALEFDAVVESVKEAISRGIQPKLVSKGSSGSYFCRDVEGTIVGIFKPKDEEPYGQLNPKWTKWIHRNLFPCCFGRACLIPNLSYISEAAASLLDQRCGTNIVPRTGLIQLSSPAFHYDWIDRRAATRKKKPLPVKVGSFQVFLVGFQDATEFFRANPWPDRLYEETFDEASFQRQVKKKRSMRSLSCLRPELESDEDENDGHESPIGSPLPRPVGRKGFQWTTPLVTEFRQELEKLIILDYLMRNTDRGLDNWMIKSCKAKEGATMDASSGRVTLHTSHQAPPPPLLMNLKRPKTTTETGNSLLSSVNYDEAHVHIAAIDNSLSFPFKHPDAWRSFTYGWLYLPASLIGRPFSAQTRRHFLPLLSDPAWWAGTTRALEKVFSIDPDFSRTMFDRQMAVIKGQGWNIMESLKNLNEGPLELCRRTKMLVLVEAVPLTLDRSVYEARLPLEQETRPPSELKRPESKLEQIKASVDEAIQGPGIVEPVSSMTIPGHDDGEPSPEQSDTEAGDEDRYGSSANASMLAARLRSKSLDGMTGRPLSSRSRSDLGAQIRGVLRAEPGSTLGGATSEAQRRHPIDLSKSVELVRPSESTEHGLSGGATKVGAISGVAILENLDRFAEVREEDDARARAAIEKNAPTSRTMQGDVDEDWRDRIRNRLSLDLVRRYDSAVRPAYGRSRTSVGKIHEDDTEAPARVGLVERLEVVKRNAGFFPC